VVKKHAMQRLLAKPYISVGSGKIPPPVLVMQPQLKISETAGSAKLVLNQRFGCWFKRVFYQQKPGHCIFATRFWQFTYQFW
jgi:hypothetical protein